MGKLHGTLAKAGKVKKQTPKIEKTQRGRKIPKGRAYKRILFNKRFILLIIIRFANLVVPQAGAMMKKKSPNWAAGRKDILEEENKK